MIHVFKMGPDHHHHQCPVEDHPVVQEFWDRDLAIVRVFTQTSAVILAIVIRFHPDPVVVLVVRPEKTEQLHA